MWQAVPMGILVPRSTRAIDGWHHAEVVMERVQARLWETGHDGSTLLQSLASELAVKLWTLALPLPVDASFPLFVLYATGSQSNFRHPTRMVAS